MTFNMQVQREDVHIAAFPYMPDYNESQALYWESVESWAALEQMKTGFPYYVPKVPGKFFDQKTIVIEDLVAWGDAYIKSNGTTSEPMPGSTA
ncbi:hypothetical protein D6D08_06640 [Aureobasidium pullulans]|nr:hypothetical protein D6D08_06640 [Aureobasidium pullulans]